MISELLRDAFAQAKIPESFYEMKKIINKLGLNYAKIHACPNDCMLYWGEDKDREECKRCHTSRWKPKSNDNARNAPTDKKKKKKKKTPAKILRYFPVKPRLQRLFMSSKTVEHMKWHAIESNNDDLMRHPKDSKEWKMFDSLYPEFSSDP